LHKLFSGNGARAALTLPALVLAGLTALSTAVFAQETPEFVGSQVCATCHEDQTQDWAESHHALAWTPALAENIVGDFSGVTHEHKGVTTRFYRDGETFMIETQAPDGSQTQYPVAGVAGIEPLQQYLIETEPGKLQSFDVVWDVEGARWFHLYPDQVLPAGDGFHWGGPYKNWNARCAECHATGFEKNYSPVKMTYESTQAEIGVGCESCHGPAEGHIEWTKSPSGFEAMDWSPLTPLSEKGFTVDLAEGGETELQQCAGCHARREPFGDGNPLPGTPFHDAYRLNPLRAGQYHPDGQILDEVYVYGSFLQSKMNDKGVTCTNCHDPHTAGFVAEGNAVCTQCHSEAGNPDFASLPLKTYDDPAHHFHPDGSTGAECKSCHMIERTYMGVDGRRDHSFRIPRPDLFEQTQSPDACTDCHSEQTPAWAAEAIEGWFPNSTKRGRHYGQTFAAAQFDPAGQVLNLVEIAEHRDLPAVVRAAALERLIPIANGDIARRLEPLLEDPSPLVRVGAIGVQRGALETERSARLVGLFKDPVKSVRIAAARGFLGMQIAHMPDAMAKDMQIAMGEWQASLRAKADFPETQLVLGGIGLSTRNMEAALTAFQDAVELDPQLSQAWGMIVRIHAALEDRPAALAAAQSALERIPTDPMLLQMVQELEK
jgi:predicted CXXCH cytochrome family protein